MADLGKVLVTGSSVAQEHLDHLARAGFQVHPVPGLLNEAELGSELASCTAYLLGGDEFASRAVLARATSLKVVGFLGVGYQSFIDAGAAAELGIVVTNTPGTLTNSVAEFTVGLLLAQRRQIPSYAADYRAGRSGTEDKQHDLAGHRLGIIGLGAIGTRVAEISVLGLATETAYYSRTRKPEVEERLGIVYKDLPSLLSWAENLVIMVPDTPETRGMIGLPEVALLSPGGITLVNTARPSAVTPAALLQGLASGRIRTAAFDGFYGSDVPETTELLALPSSVLLVTGHIASLTHDARDAMAVRCIQSIVNVVMGEADSCIVSVCSSA
ncbi:NAD(P)-dependent oxidoreductase [Streptomyces sp. NPDC047023]|uniref:2-hydroxyacid dehydrogenase n=1 Tax=Streptomyces sp. NPDC047023 TaxID=3155139 RepID=UPI00340EA983